jgi:hypothetical protein
MTNKISSSGISNGSRITSSQLKQLTDALSASDLYAIQISGSLDITGSATISDSITATSLSGEGSAITGIISASYAVSSSQSDASISSSYAVSSSHTLSGNGSFQGSLTGSLLGTSYIVLSQVSESLHYATDAAAGLGGVPLGGLYRSGSLIKIRMS